MIASIITVFLYAGSSVFATRATRLIDPGRANLIRFVFALTCLTIWVAFTGLTFSGPGVVWFLISGMIGFGIGDTALFEAYSRIGSRRALLLNLALSAPIAAVTELLWLGEPLRLRDAVCIGLILSGVLLALGRNREQHAAGRSYRIGIAFGIAAAFCQGWGAVISRKGFAVAAADGLPIDAIASTFLRLGAGIVIPVLVVSWHLRQEKPLRGKVTWAVVALCAVTGFLGPVAGVACFQFALATTPSAIVLAIVATTPLVVVPLSWWSEGDRPSPLSVIGAVIASTGVAGLFLANW